MLRSREIFVKTCLWLIFKNSRFANVLSFVPYEFRCVRLMTSSCYVGCTRMVNLRDTVTENSPVACSISDASSPGRDEESSTSQPSADASILNSQNGQDRPNSDEASSSRSEAFCAKWLESIYVEFTELNESTNEAFKELTKHTINELEQIEEPTTKKLKELKERTMKLLNNLLQSTEEFQILKEQAATELKKLVDEASMADRPMGEQEQLNSLQELLGRYNETLTYVNAKLQELAPNTDLTNLSRQADRVDQINRLFSETKSRVEILMKDVQKLNGYKMMFETLIQQLNSKMENIEKKLGNLNQEHLSMEASNLELQRTFDEMQRTSYDGTFIWRIHPFKEKFADAEHGRQLSLYSPPFYSHPYGYKMQARIFLAGDGSGKGTHLSFFFLICKGDYDALLHWPFKLMVNLRILNSRDRSGKNDKVQKFKPDGGVSFQKPTALMNQATGLPQFIRHKDLMDCGRGFVDENEDALYIAVVVNAEDETARPIVYKKIQ